LAARLNARSGQIKTLGIAELWLVRGRELLILERASGRGRGFWMVPGGAIEPGEPAEKAARRETLEETGLRAAHLELLRKYRWQLEGDAYVRAIASFVAEAPDGDVVLSDEHTAYAWTTPEAYIERYCGVRAEEAAPPYAGMFRQLRATCELVARWMERRPVRKA
jgi:8-oxo-dGTP diphosphatase